MRPKAALNNIYILIKGYRVNLSAIEKETQNHQLKHDKEIYLKVIERLKLRARKIIENL